MIGKQFGLLTVIRDGGVHNKNRYYWCRCECGRIKMIRGVNLSSGATKSCGCYAAKVSKDRLSKNSLGLKHGMSKTRLYRIWCAMRTRCGIIGSFCNENYGGRGIKVCDEWANDFVCFSKWALSNGYSDGLTLDRINVNGDYSPKNCRWCTNAEQQNNKRNNHFVFVCGKKFTIAQASRAFGIPQSSLSARLKRLGL